MIEIRQATISDKPEIFNFLSKAYQEKSPYKFPERWEWEFQNNPFKNDHNLPVWIATDNANKIVGQIGVMVEPLKVGSQTDKTLSWAVDLIVLPEYRDQKIGFRLAKAIYEANDNLMALPMSEAFRHYMNILGSVQVDTVAVYKRFVYLESETLSEIIKNRLTSLGIFGRLIFYFSRLIYLHKIISWVGNAYIFVRDFFRLRSKNDELIISENSGFDQGFDAFWDSVSSDFEVIVKRDSKFLTWKYNQQPFVNYKVFTAIKDNKISGYTILRTAVPPESDSGIIADLLVSPEHSATIETLINYAVGYFKARKVRYISVASSVQSYQKALVKLGFKKQKEMHPLLHAVNKAHEYATLTKEGAWFLGRSDHDWDQYPNG